MSAPWASAGAAPRARPHGFLARGSTRVPPHEGPHGFLRVGSSAQVPLREDALREEAELEKSRQRASTQDSDVVSDSPARNAFNRLSPVGLIIGTFVLFALIKKHKRRCEWSQHGGGSHPSLSACVTRK